MYCKYCGYQLPDDAQFCPNCGKQNPNPAESNNSQATITSSVSQAAEISNGAVANESQQTKSQQTRYQQTESDQTKSKEIPSLSEVGQKKNGLFSKPIIVIAAVAIVVLLVAIVVSVALMSGGGQATIHIDSDPSGAEVYIDSEYRGVTPISAKLSPDKTYSISIKKSGYDTWSKTITPSAQDQRTVTATLTPTTSILSITSNPSGAQIYVNGQYYGSTPANVEVYPNQQYPITIKKSGYNDWSDTVTSSSGITTVSATLTSSSALYITSNPSGAQVYIGSEYYGETPVTVNVRPNSQYSVSLKKLGYYDWTQTVSSLSSGTKTVSTSLTQSPTLYITSYPSGADVYVSGKNYGETPTTVNVYPDSVYTISIQKSGYYVWEDTVTSKSYGQRTVDARLVPIY